MRYLAVIEPSGRGWSGFVPDLPGCVATGRSAKQARRRLAAAIRLHLAGLAAEGDPPPRPAARGALVKPRG